MVDKVPIEAGIIARVTGAWKALTGKGTVVDSATAWMGPENPVQPVVPPQQAASVQGRQFDYPTGYNLRITPRSGEAVTFHQMRALADSCDVLRLVIETRKDQLEGFDFTVKSIDDDAERDDRCKQVEAFFRRPDGENDWSSWLRQLLEELFVTDAATIYPWLTNGGKPYRFELLDGATIKRVIDERGRTPAEPATAYQQVLKGVTAFNYTQRELIYAPRNKRVHKVYGYSPVEQIIVTVNIAIRRALYQLQYYTEGSAPDLIFTTPASWNMAQIKDFNEYWGDMLSGQTGTRRQARFVPDGIKVVNTKDAVLKDEYDEWLTRIICYAFSVSPQAFVKTMNRATAETQQEMAMQEGLRPVMLWVKGVIDRLIQDYFGYTDLQFTWNDQAATAPDVQAKIDDTNVKNGTSTINEIRAQRGDDPVAGGDVPMALTPTGYVPITAATEEPPLDDGMQPPTPVTEKIAKVAKRPKSVRPINRDRPAIVKVRKDTATGVHHILQDQLAGVVAKLKSVTKADDKDDEQFPDLFSDWEDKSDEFHDLFGDQFVAAAKSGTEAAYAQIDADNPDALSLANDKAVDYARDRSAWMVGKTYDDDGNLVDNPDAEYSIDDSTREMIRGDITTAMEQGMSNGDLADLLSQNYAFSDDRAMMIARTETAAADVQGNLALYRESGQVDTKEWIVGEDCCDDCQQLDGEVVSLDGTFSDGSDAPPAHPMCRCDVLPGLSASTGGASALDDETEE